MAAPAGTPDKSLFSAPKHNSSGGDGESRRVESVACRGCGQRGDSAGIDCQRPIKHDLELPAGVEENVVEIGCAMVSPDRSRSMWNGPLIFMMRVLSRRKVVLHHRIFFGKS